MSLIAGIWITHAWALWSGLVIAWVAVNVVLVYWLIVLIKLFLEVKDVSS